MRQVVLDTETTGLDPLQGHRIIEIGCVEIVDRQITGGELHHYVNPKRPIEAYAQTVHGLTEVMLVDKPSFAEIAGEVLEYIRGAQLIIHNADFDIGFLYAEIASIAGPVKAVKSLCQVEDTLLIARSRYPRQRNSLDALCDRYHIDKSHRGRHGALVDARLLANVYLKLTAGDE